MSRPAVPIPPVLAFATLNGSRWGVAAGGEQGLVAIAEASAPGPAEVAPGLLRRTGAGQWEIQRNGDLLTAVEQAADVTGESDADAGESDADAFRLVRLDGAADATGLVHPGGSDASADSARMLFAWFPGGLAVALLAVRPPRAKGQDRDELSVACIGEPAGQRVFDPRLSSTYDEHGLLRRVGVELWLGESEDGDLHSLRLAGEALGPVARLELDGALVQAQPFTGHSRGEAGIGVYVLITHP
ncbi:MAG TPA: hypothetical protein VFP55_06980 [Solirubrobacteraceae bacterium]|nr:hypothetical protein [Solirubrobacteraceae bacterium]